MCESRFVDLFMHDGSDGAGDSSQLQPVPVSKLNSENKEKRTYVHTAGIHWTSLDLYIKQIPHQVSSMVSNYQWTGGTNQYSLAVFFTCFKLTLSSDDN